MTFLILAVTIVVGMILWKWLRDNLASFREFEDIELVLRKHLGRLSDYASFQKQLPIFRLPDVHRALDVLTEGTYERITIESEHAESLGQILAAQFYAHINRKVRKPQYISRPIDLGREAFYPCDGFLILRELVNRNAEPILVRVKVDTYRKIVLLEVGAVDEGDARAFVDTALELASEHSIYRQRTVDVSFEREVRDEYGEVEEQSALDIRFLPMPAVEKDDIILDEVVERVLNRNVFDFHERRDLLRSLGLPGRRGLLFYGPPGTGKTYSCKYIAHRLTDVTTVAVTGRALLHIRSICQIARMLQPSLIILEDVDLVYSSRDLAVGGAFLGELMDELDGFAAEDQILFILTTNALDRVEAAIKDRPGRISQCVYFGYPGLQLRRRYLETLTSRFSKLDKDLDAVARLTDRTSQAFLKEMVFRTAQIASANDSLPLNGAKLHLQLQHFDEAIAEMKRGAGTEGAAILGFKAD